MNKHFLKILVVTLILLMGIGAVNALESNSTDALMSFEQNDMISVDDSSEVLTVENDNDGLISATNSSDEVLTAKNNTDEAIAVSNNESCEVMSVENDNDDVISLSNDNSSDVVCMENDNVISVSNDDEILTANNAADDKLLSSDDDSVESKTQFKVFTVAKIKIPVKFKRFMNNYVPSKKNKNAWKQYKIYKRYMKNINKIAKKIGIKFRKKLDKNHWHIYDNWYKIKKSGKYYVGIFYAEVYRTYNYDPVSKKGWWD